MRHFRFSRARVVRRGVCAAFAGILAQHGIAQHAEQDLPRGDSSRTESHLYDIMKRGELDGRFRLYNMATWNDGAPSDYHAVAFGGALGFRSRRWHGWQFALSGGYTFDLSSSDLNINDAVTGQPNRYEIGLFDIDAPERTSDLAYLQIFQLNFLSRSQRSHVIFGRQELNTPFLNAQDGRMQPTLFEGFWARHRFVKGPAVQGGWLYGVSPRSTSGWYTTAESASLYPVGRNTSGASSAYVGSQDSKGIFVLSAEQHVHRKVNVALWDVFVENIFNTAMVQVELGKADDRWSASVLGLAQQPVAHGTAASDEHAYLPADEGSFAGSARLRYVLKRIALQANYTRITAHGRYLMPREWGREPFFTFLPRERNEGAGDVHAASLNLIRKLNNGWRIQTDAGIYHMPGITGARLNKYAMPSYTQFDVNVQYQFKGGWKGLAAQVLVLAKIPLNEELTEKQSINKVDMLHADLIINYVF